jgi:hypothetical protein
MTRLLVIAVALVGLLPIGCLHRQVARDGIGSRQAVLDVYTDQIMDNLIRARKGLPFVQLTYRDILVQDLDSVNAGVGDTIGSEADKSFGAVLFTGVVRKWTNSLAPTAAAKRDRTISFHADPVTDKNDIYEYYLAFASDPTLLVESDSKPEGPVHIARRCGKTWYYVPCEAAGVFLQLALKTTFMRGPEKLPGPDYFEANIQNVVIDKEASKGKAMYGYVIFDRNIKNDDGFMIVTLTDKRQFRFDLFRLTRDVPKVGDINVGGKLKPLGDDANVFVVSWNQENTHVTDENLRNGKAKIYLQHYAPPPPPPIADLQRLNDNLDQIRLNQLNQANK